MTIELNEDEMLLLRGLLCSYRGSVFEVLEKYENCNIGFSDKYSEKALVHVKSLKEKIFGIDNLISKLN